MKTFKILAFLLAIPMTASTQTYIGQILLRNTYTYAKLKCENDTCTFSLPYVDGDKKFSLLVDPTQKQEWQITRQAAVWNFNTQIENGLLTGTLKTPGGIQEIQFFEQKPAIERSHLTSYEGVYEDEVKRRVIIYSRFNFLHIISPYSEETMSLKPIGKHTFWSVSGEQSIFENRKEDKFRNLSIFISGQAPHKLTRIPDMTIQELLIPTGTDTLYAQLFLPPSDTLVPACLILPGGGAVGMDNYTYEARLFAAHGIAAMVFDKSGNGKSKGGGHFEYQSFEDKNEQYKALFRYLQAHPKVDKQKTGVHGPSEGARIALMMAIDLGPDLAFVIAVAGPYMTLREGQLFAMDHHHRNLGLRQSDNMNIQLIWNEYYDGVVRGEIDPSTIDKANAYRQRNDRLFLPPDTTALPVSPHADDIENDRTVQGAGKIVTPLLLQYGENDQRVDMAGSLQNLMPRLTHPERVTTIIYKRGGHNVMTPEFKICTGYTSDKINWLKHIGIIR